MEKQRLAHLKQQFQFESWCGCNSLRENLFIWNYFLMGDEFPGWQLHANQPVAAPGWPPFIQSVWRPSEDDKETALRIDIYQCSSRIKAHEFLINVLGQFHLPAISRQGTVDIGDVAFTGSTDTGILFARANFVLLVSNAGRHLESVTEVVRPFDNDLCSKPKKVAKAEAAPKIRRFVPSSKEYRVGENIPMEFEAVDYLHQDKVLRLKGEDSVPLESSLYFKFFSPLSGEVFMEEDRLVYKPSTPGSQKVTVVAINAQRDITSKVSQLDIKSTENNK